MLLKCQQCGRCCKALNKVYHIYATDEDVERWEREERDDILRWVDSIEVAEGEYEHDFAINPRTGEEVTGSCPFLGKVRGTNLYRCRIQSTKPAACQIFPMDAEDGARVGCPGWSQPAAKAQ